MYFLSRSLCRGSALYLHTERRIHRINALIYYCLEWIRTLYPSVVEASDLEATVPGELQYERSEIQSPLRECKI
jgi:hypothetical protein